MRRICLLILTVIAVTTSQAQKVQLALNLEVNKEYKQNTNAKATIVQDISGQKMTMVMIVKGNMTYLVKAINDNEYDMEVRYESLNVEMQLPQGSMMFSSEKLDENDVFSMILSEMKDKPFQVIMEKNGKIKAVKNVESLFASAFNKFPDLTEAQKEQIKSQLMKAYGEEAFKGNIEMLTAIFPDKSVSKGDQWEIKTKLESGMSANMTTVYTLEENTPTYNLIRGDSKIETEDKDAYVDTNGMPMKYDLSGTMTSEIKVDRKTGWIIEARTNQEVTGDAYIKGNPQMPDGMKIPMELKSETLISEN